MKNILTFDIEEAKHMHIGGEGLRSSPEEFRAGLSGLLDLLEKYGAKATFFVVAELAKEHGDLMRRIVEEGHELAHHSLNHRHLLGMIPEQFEKDLKEGKEILEKASGFKIIGYRAPSWSADTKETSWLWEVLKENGFEYSSSLMPFKTPLYGNASAPRFPYSKETSHGEILEFPVPTVRVLGINIPFSGGAYFRFLMNIDRGIYEYFWRKNGFPLMYYFHLRDLGFEKIPPGLSLSGRSVNYWGRFFARKRFEKLLDVSEFTSFKEILPELIKSREKR